MNIKIEKLEYVDWKNLTPLQPSDLKKQSKQQLDKLKRSLIDGGFRSPFLVWQNNKKIYILDGHHRVPALKLLEDEGLPIPAELPAIFIKCKDKSEAKKSILIYNSHYADIKQESLSDWIKDLNINDLLNTIDIKGIDLTFGAEDVNDLDAEPQIDKADELKNKWGVESGQLWVLGDHKIICGDSAKPEVYNKLLCGEKYSICFTDPPYGVSIGNKNKMLNSFQKAGRNLKSIESDDLSPQQLKSVLQPIFEMVKENASSDCSFFVCAPQGGDLGMMMMMMMDAGLKVRHVLMWKKNSPTFSMGRLDYDYQHEPILLTWGKNHKRPMKGSMRTSVWEVDKPRSNKEHPTMKPVELYVNAYLNNSDHGDIALEPFSGSGTAIIAAENTGRKCRAIEIDPGYVAVAIQRWADATGKTPLLTKE